ncbi:hypothetical protein Tco_0938668 [Tanacetum coccineum]|uniref:Uncharacterized protein n=1 Tax=Tanacetum coccineum TaxID=301880 RepID=A0ABQ5DKK3_9ASTR
MAPSTRQTSGSNNGEELVNKQYVDDAMTEIRQTLAAMNSTITALSINNSSGKSLALEGKHISLAELASNGIFQIFMEMLLEGWVSEATLEVIKKKNKPLGSHHVGRFGMSSDSGSSNKPPLLPFPYANNISNPNPTTALKTPVRKQLTQKEYEEKRAKNMGFYCDKKFVPGHKCEGKLSKLKPYLLYNRIFSAKKT